MFPARVPAHDARQISVEEGWEWRIALCAVLYLFVGKLVKFNMQAKKNETTGRFYLLH